MNEYCIWWQEKVGVLLSNEHFYTSQNDVAATKLQEIMANPETYNIKFEARTTRRKT